MRGHSFVTSQTVTFDANSIVRGDGCNNPPNESQKNDFPLNREAHLHFVKAVNRFVLLESCFSSDVVIGDQLVLCVSKVDLAFALDIWLSSKLG